MLNTLVALAVVSTTLTPAYQPTAGSRDASFPQEPQRPTAQQPSPENPPARPDLRSARSTGPVYRFDVTIVELEGKTRTNSRSYTLLQRVGGDRGTGSLRVGSRVPINSDKGVNYTNVGVNIDIGDLAETDGSIGGFIGLEVSSLAPGPEQGQSVPGAPVMRTLTLRSPFNATPGKPAIVATIDDVNSTRKFQVELTATKM